ncbi:MAG: hypothetical protein JXR89_06735 [Deltaproteobacteria bacterium]|nr:hypothetical protein [Deltaproteobacteria bacterium]
MKPAQPVRFGAWVLIALNLFMAYGSIWVFMRMAPAIEIIIEQNEVSLQACEEMLAALSLHRVNENDSAPHETFARALRRAQANITENEEPQAIDLISRNFSKAFLGQHHELQETVKAILRLGEINRLAMIKADRKARQLSYAGAWAIVFMATIIFLSGMIFMRSLRKNLYDPIEEIDAVVKAFRNGDVWRRCNDKNTNKTIRQIFVNLNELLDKHGAQNYDRKL